MQNVHAGNAAIPSIGSCTYGMTAADIHRMIPAALGAGFRHIDTAQIYRNEGESHAAPLATTVDSHSTMHWTVHASVVGTGVTTDRTTARLAAGGGRHIPRQSKP
ncbi:hypothetical protein [Paraburkholderia bryophila]|uniref:Diketogulonate reductase-like aldo/keto reductase n=1 Tax=Paraburkholderia bryophila TaxID=420952 RepID=A0A7Y9W6G9_9BURK|nr:hypothetical protein [Paraburkholderia bryophila]NYH14536.1 diketogulonate reductase-like aldo/keto reductase [Paraburkholderia bryophila]